MRKDFWWENLLENVHLKDQEVYEGIILRLTIS
jgi:hypothetical protein